MKNSTKKSILLFYQSYKENAPYDFDSNQIKHLFEKFKIKKYDKNIPKKLKNNYLENSQEYSNLFSLFFLLYYIKYYTEKLDKSIFHQDFEKAKKAYDKVFTEFILVTTIFTELEVLFESKFSTDIKFFTFDYSRFFETLRNSIFIYERKPDSKKFKFLIRSDIRLLDDRINTFKFLLSFFFIIISPFYNQKHKDSALNVLKVLKIILNKSTLQYIQIQKKKVNFFKKVQYRGQKDGTTRILGIFTRYNDDVFLFRLDFPHVKETEIHVNLHEKKGKKLVDAYFPMTKEEIDKYNISDEFLEKITLFQEGLYWFKSNLKQNVAETKLPADVKESFNKIFRQESHFEFESGELEKCYNKMLKNYLDIFLKLNVDDDAYVEDFNREDSKNVEIIQNILNTKVCNDCLILHSFWELGKDDDSIKDIMGLDDDRYNYYKNEIIPIIEDIESGRTKVTE